MTASALVARLADLCMIAVADHGPAACAPQQQYHPEAMREPMPNLGGLTAPANERGMLPLTATAAIDLGALPSGPCPVWGGGLWWRVSVLSGGPNPWLCRRCEWPNPGMARWACSWGCGLTSGMDLRPT